MRAQPDQTYSFHFSKKTIKLKSLRQLMKNLKHILKLDRDE